MVAPVFIDATHAAETLHVAVDQVVDWIAEGKLTSYGGKASNPFLRSADVSRLASELGVEASEQPRRTKSASAKVQARLTADSRWSDISETEIEEWAMRADASRKAAARTAAAQAITRLRSVLELLEA